MVEGDFLYTLNLVPAVNFRVGISFACLDGYVMASYTSTEDATAVNMLTRACPSGVWVFEDVLHGMCPRVLGGTLSRTSCEIHLPCVCKRAAFAPRV